MINASKCKADIKINTLKPLRCFKLKCVGCVIWDTSTVAGSECKCETCNFLININTLLHLYTYKGPLLGTALILKVYIIDVLLPAVPKISWSLRERKTD